MNWRLLLIFISCISPIAHADNHGMSSLCKADETVVFSCAISKKLVSLCATQKLTHSSGQLVYRFGKLNHAPELEYSNNSRSVADAFRFHYDGWAKGSYQAVQFQLNDHTYTIYNRMAAFEENDRSNGGGILIHRQKEQVADLWCSNRSIQDKLYEALNNLGLPGIDDPYAVAK